MSFKFKFIANLEFCHLLLRKKEMKKTMVEIERIKPGTALYKF